MKKAKTWLCLCLMICLTVLAPRMVSAGEAELSELKSEGAAAGKSTALLFRKVSYYRYSSGNLPLYRRANAKSKKLTVSGSTRLKVTGVRGDGWARVRYKNRIYYCRTARLSKTNGYIVAVDAGHQEKANTALEPIGPGARQSKMKVSGGTAGVSTRLPEYKLTLTVAKQLETMLKARGYKVVMVRTGNDVNLSNKERAQIANHAKADVFIRIHANGWSDSGMKGALTISPSSKNPYCKNIYEQSNRLSSSVLTEFCKATGAKNRGILYDDTMAGINWSEVPVTIIEMGFMTNPEEDRKMAAADYQKKMTEGIANGIDAYLGR